MLRWCKSTDYNSTMNEAKYVFCLFGPLIKIIVVTQKETDKLFNDLVEHCSREKAALCALLLNDFSIDAQLAISLRPVFFPI